MNLLKKYAIAVVVVFGCNISTFGMGRNDNLEIYEDLHKNGSELEETRELIEKKEPHPVTKMLGKAVHGVSSFVGSVGVVLTPGILATALAKYYGGNWSARIIGATYVIPFCKVLPPVFRYIYYQDAEQDQEQTKKRQKELSSAVDAPLASGMMVAIGTGAYILYNKCKPQAENVSLAEGYGFPTTALVVSASFILLERLFDRLIYPKKYADNTKNTEWSIKAIICKAVYGGE